LALHFALFSAGNSIEANIAMIATTTSSSMSVNPSRAREVFPILDI
jgi:hypothetical protein